MTAKNITLTVVDKNVLSKTITLTPDGASLRINAVPGARYLLTEGDTAQGPKKISAKRIGKDLAIGEADSKAGQIIVEDFYAHPGEVIGVGEDSQYHLYINSDAGNEDDHEAAQFEDGDSAFLVMDSAQAQGIGTLTLPDSPGIGLLGLAGILAGALAVGGIALAAGGGGGSGGGDNGNGIAPGDSDDNGNGIAPGDSDDNGDASSPGDGVDDGEDEESPSLPDTTPPAAPQLNKSDEQFTNNPARPITGTGEPGATVVIRDNGVPIGSAIVGEDGSWSFIPSPGLDEGSHSVDAVQTDAAGNVSQPSAPWIIEVDITPPAVPSFEGALDDTGERDIIVPDAGATTDDLPLLLGRADPGATLEIFHNGTSLGRVIASDQGTWSLQILDKLPIGQNAFSAVSTDAAGNSSSSDFSLNVMETPLANWDFNDGTFQGWSRGENYQGLDGLNIINGSILVATAISDKDYSGTLLYQDLYLRPGHTYTFSYDYSVALNQVHDSNIGLMINGEIVIPADNISGNKTVTFTATEGGSVRFEMFNTTSSHDGNAALLDNFQLIDQGPASFTSEMMSVAADGDALPALASLLSDESYGSLSTLLLPQEQTLLPQANQGETQTDFVQQLNEIAAGDVAQDNFPMNIQPYEQKQELNTLLDQETQQSQL